MLNQITLNSCFRFSSSKLLESLKNVALSASLNLAVLLLAANSFAQDVPAGQVANSPVRLTLHEVIAIAKDKSPDVAALRSQLASAEAKARQIFSLAEPLLGISYNDMDWAFHIGGQASTVYSIQQTIGFPGKAFLARSAARSVAKSIAEQLRSMELQVAANAKNAFNQLVFAQASLQLNYDQRSAYERILAIARRRYESGAIPQVDLLNAQLALYGNDNDLSDLKAAEKTAQTALNVFLQNPPDKELLLEPIKLSQEPIPSFEDARALMEKRRPEILAAQHALKAADASYGLAKMSWLPDFTFTAATTSYNLAWASPWSAAPSPSPDGFQPRNLTQTFQFGVQVQIPIWFLFNERESIRGARQDLATADANLRILNNSSLNSLKSTLETLNSQQNRLQTYEKHLLPISEQALSIALVSYSAGKIDFQTLVDTAATRRNTRRDYLTAEVNYASNAATLGQLIGEER